MTDENTTTNTGSNRFETTPTPISRPRNSSHPHSNIPLQQQQQQSSITLWKLLLIELNIPGLSDTNDKQTQTPQDTINNNDFQFNLQILLNYIKIPLQVEKFMLFGLLSCLIIFLKIITITPLRLIINIYYFIRSSFTNNQFKNPPSQKLINLIIFFKTDIIIILLISLTLLLLKDIDSSKIYHNIRAGTAVKLYFMVGALEVADKLLSVIGQDIIKLLSNINIINFFNNNKKKINLKLIFITISTFSISLFYLSLHSIVFIYQTMALNVAINSYSNALLTLIISNQFSELKSSVFKKSEREGLFQISCADLNERFQLFLMLFIISSRNLFQMYGFNSTGFQNNIKPNSWLTNLKFSNFLNDWFGFIMGPMFIVIGSEIIVDWLKHSYITRFNRIKPTIYQKYSKILAIDYINNFKNDLSIDLSSSTSTSTSTTTTTPPEITDDTLSHSLIKRTGLPLLSSLIVLIKMTIYPWLNLLIHNNDNMAYSIIGFLLVLIIFIILIFLRMILSLILLKWSNQIIKSNNSKFNKSPPLNDFIKGDPNVNLSDLKSNERHLLYDENEKIPPSLQDLRTSKILKKTNNLEIEDKLNQVNRFEMCDKRIW